MERLDQSVKNSRIEDALNQSGRVFNAGQDFDSLPDVARLATFLPPLCGDCREHGGKHRKTTEHEFG